MGCLLIILIAVLASVTGSVFSGFVITVIGLVIVLAFVWVFSVQEKEDQIAVNRSTLRNAGVTDTSENSLLETERAAIDSVYNTLKDLDIAKKDLVDTRSSLGICAFKRHRLVTGLKVQTSSYENENLLDYFLPITIETFHKERDCVANNKTAISVDDLKTYDKHLKKCLTVNGNTPKLYYAKIINLSEIEYYKIEGSEQFASEVSGGGANISGAVVGGMVAGTAGAIVGGQGEVKTTIVKKDARRLYLSYRQEGVIKTEEILADEIESVIALLRKWMPQKDYHYVLAHVAKTADNQHTVPAIKSDPPRQSYAELKELKELLDMGIVTQEEFDRKKKQILG